MKNSHLGLLEFFLKGDSSLLTKLCEGVSMVAMVNTFCGQIKIRFENRESKNANIEKRVTER